MTIPYPAAGTTTSGASRRRWRWRWVRRSAVLAVAVAVLAASGASGSTVEQSPQEVVAQYLRVLQAGDVQAARSVAQTVPQFAEVSDDLLVAEAMATDWAVTRLVRRYTGRDDPAVVDVTVAADGMSRQGRFELERSDGGRWRILNPLVKLDLSLVPMRYVELNGVTSHAKVLWLFPGLYRPYGSTQDLIRVGAPMLVAMPNARSYLLEGGRGIEQERFLPTVQATEAGLAAVHDQLAAWVDRCAAIDSPFPAGCPFAAGYRDYGEVWVESGNYEAEGADVTWQVLTYPRVRLVQADGAFEGHLLVPGRLQITGTAVSLYGQEIREQLQGRCTVRLPQLRVTIPRPQEFAFQIDQERTDLACSEAQYYQ